MIEIPVGMWLFLGILVGCIAAICVAIMMKSGEESAATILKALKDRQPRKIISAGGSIVIFDRNNNPDDNNQQPPSTTVGPNRLTDEALKLILQGRIIVGREEDADGPA